MPLYDYRCTECGRVVEVIHGIYERGPETCQHCAGAMRKALSSPAIHFKGKGWAKKDAAAATAKKSAPAPSSSSSGSGSSDTGGSGKDGSVKKTEKTDSTAASGADSGGKTAPTTGNTTDD